MTIPRNDSLSSAWLQLSGIFDSYFSSQNSISTELDDDDDIMDDEDDEPLQATLEVLQQPPWPLISYLTIALIATKKSRSASASYPSLA